MINGTLPQSTFFQICHFCRVVDSQRINCCIRIQALDQEPKSLHNLLHGLVTTNADRLVEIHLHQSYFTEQLDKQEPDIAFSNEL